MTQRKAVLSLMPTAGSGQVEFMVGGQGNDGVPYSLLGVGHLEDGFVPEIVRHERGQLHQSPFVKVLKGAYFLRLVVDGEDGDKLCEFCCRWGVVAVASAAS